MKLLVFAAITAIALARPDISLVNKEDPPPTRYGTPSENRQYYHLPEQPLPSIPSGSYLPGIPNLNLETPVNHEHVSISSSFPSSTEHTPINKFSLTGTAKQYKIVGGGALNSGKTIAWNPYVSDQAVFTQGQTLLPTSPFISRLNTISTSYPTTSFISTPDSIPSSISTSSFSSGQDFKSISSSSKNFQNYNSQQAEVQKHLYFFSAPEEPEEYKPKVQIPVVAPKKNIKILFIKAPTYKAPAPIQIPVQPQNEEKTIVYVLVKKPEDQPQVHIAPPAPIKPSKPEVYFIKYKTHKEAEEAISNVQQGATDSGASVIANSVNSDQDFTNLIKSDVDNSLDTRFSSEGVSVSSGDTGAFAGVSSTTGAPLVFNSGFVSSTPSPLVFNSGIVSSTPSPLVFSSGIVSSTTGSPLVTPDTFYGPPGDSGPY